jgi:hypothetical protein
MFSLKSQVGEPLASDEPSLRLQALGQRPGPAAVLSQLERLVASAAPGGDPEEEEEVVVVSGGTNDGNMAEVTLHGQKFALEDPGIHVLILSEQRTITAADSFVLHKALKGMSPGDPGSGNNRTAAFEALRRLPANRVVVVVKKGGGEFKDEDVEALALIGANKRSLEQMDKHDSFAMVGIKGAGSKSTIMVHAPSRSGKATLRCKIPRQAPSLALEPTTDGLGLLLTLISQYQGAAGKSPEGRAALSSGLRLLASNLCALFQGSTRKAVASVLLTAEGDEPCLLQGIIDLILAMSNDPAAESAVLPLFEVLLGPSVLPWLVTVAPPAVSQTLVGGMARLALEAQKRLLAPSEVKDPPKPLEGLCLRAYSHVAVRWLSDAANTDTPTLEQALLSLLENFDALASAVESELKAATQPLAVARVLSVCRDSPSFQLMAAAVLVAFPSKGLVADRPEFVFGSLLRIIATVQGLLGAARLAPPEASHFLAELDRSAASAFAAHAAALLDGLPWDGDKEEKWSPFVSLLDPGAALEGEEAQALELLRQLATQGASSILIPAHPVRTLLAALRKRLPWPLNPGEHVLQSEYAAAAVMFHYLGLGKEALQVSTGAVQPSDALVSAWREGWHWMHALFNTGNLKEVEDFHGRGPSQDEEKLEEEQHRQASTRHIGRAVYLLDNLAPHRGLNNPPSSSKARDHRGQVLQFLTEGNVEEVRQACKLRETRAALRAEGLERLLQLLRAVVTGASRLAVVQTWMRFVYSTGKRQDPSTTGRLSVRVPGARAATRARVTAAFHNVTRELLSYLKEGGEGEGGADARRWAWSLGYKVKYSCPGDWVLPLYVLKALAVDYDRRQDSVVIEAALGPAQAMLEHPEPAVRVTADALVSLLLSKAPQAVVHDYLTARVGAARQVLRESQEGMALSARAGTVPDANIVGPFVHVLKGPVRLADGDGGRVLSFRPAAPLSSLSLWLLWGGPSPGDTGQGMTGVVLSHGCPRVSGDGSRALVWHHLGLTADGRVVFTSTDRSCEVMGERSLVAGVWEHVFVAWSTDSDAVELFVNGEPDGRCPLPQHLVRTPLIDVKGYPVFLGRVPPYLRYARSAHVMVAHVVGFEASLCAELLPFIVSEAKDGEGGEFFSQPFRTPNEAAYLKSLGQAYSLAFTNDFPLTPDVALELLRDVKGLTSVKARLCAARLLRSSLSVSRPTDPASQAAMVQALMLEIGRTVGASGGVHRTTGGEGPAEVLDTAPGAFALAAQSLETLRTLGNSNAWAGVVHEAVLQALRAKEPWRLASPEQSLLLLSAYVILGGGLPGLHLGSEGQWQVDDSGKVFEECTVLGRAPGDDGSVLIVVHSKPEQLRCVNIRR